MMLAASTNATVTTRLRSMLSLCPRCGAVPIAAVASGFLADGRVAHVWACEECGHAFDTVVGPLTSSVPLVPECHPEG